MENIKTISAYYQKIIDLVIELHHSEFSNAISGHCMKITGLGIRELEYLWDILKTKYAQIDTYIVDEIQSSSDKYISATKLIELRNRQDKPLMVLIPSNSRTAAEDSYGNATFKEISLDGIDVKLKDKLLSALPDEFKKVIQDDILNYLKYENINLSCIINYLVALDTEGLNKKNIGDFIFYLNLIPDSDLIDKVNKTRSRLNFNLISTKLLSAFNKPLHERISELPLETNTLQKQLVDCIKSEKSVKTADSLCQAIFEKYPNLNFSNWQIPDLNFEQIKLICEEIKSSDFKVEDGVKVLRTESNNTSKVKIRFTTKPNPKDIEDLRFFKIVLMAVDGGAGEEMTVLRRLKNTSTNRTYREAIVELNSNSIDEGSYFFRVFAEDEHGNILNADDDFKDAKVQKAWLEAKAKDSDIPKSSFNYKLTCDTEDFHYVLEENVEKEEINRKDKLNNALQAYFKYRIQVLKSGEAAVTIPVPTEGSNIWLNNDKSLHTSTFHINYSDKHNYQINLSSKLRSIEDVFLKNKSLFGHVKAYLRSNSVANGFESLQFIKSDLMTIMPDSISKLRTEVFTRIQESNNDNNGVFETADIFNFYAKIKEYLIELSSWTSELKSKVSSQNVSIEEKSKLQHFLTELQILDFARIKTKLPDGQLVEAILLSPLHPLRLAWAIELLEVFHDWEKKTQEYQGYKESWSKYLEYLFDGQLPPENNPLVLVEPSSFKNYHYSGELAYGWGIYLNVLTEESNNGMTSVSRQLKHYFRVLFNIIKDNYVETDISQKLVVKHIKNYLVQHPYTDKLILNLFNAGDAHIFADAFVELEKENLFKGIKYEARIFKGNDRIIEHGEGLKNLINPESNISEEAEAFSQPSQNRLFPKLRFSINNISDYLENPSKFTAHISFLISPFPVKIELIKPFSPKRNFFLNGLITNSSVTVDEANNDIKWNRYLQGNELVIPYEGMGKIAIELFDNIQTFISGALASKYTESIPATQLMLNNRDKVLLAHLHDYSDWVITFDKNLGPQIFDQPSTEGNIPFLLDYIPGEEISGISSYITTRPTSEILGLLGPHFEVFNLNIHDEKDEIKIKMLLEDLRAVSSSLILQLNSSKNKAFEVIGSAFTKRVLEKKGFLKESFLIPIDLHQNLFENLISESKSRADNLLVSINPEKREISICIIEIKCRKAVGEAEKNELKSKMKEQIENTIEAIRSHFDPEYHHSFDRLDRELKNKELKLLLNFYLERAYRYKYLSNNAYETYSDFLQFLDNGFTLKFTQLGLIFNFSASKKHHKEIIDNELTFFTLGEKLIKDILDPDSDLNTMRLEKSEFDDELSEVIGTNNSLQPFIQKYEIKKRKDNITSVERIPNQNSVVEEGRSNQVTGNQQSNEPEKLYKLQQEGDISIGKAPNIEEVNPTLEPELMPFNSSVIYEHLTPKYDILVGKSSPSEQFGVLGESLHGKKIAVDLSETNTISLFGVQGGGKSYTIGTVSEMVLKQFSNINELPAPLAGVIFHYSESMDYEPEFTSIIYPNDKKNELQKLKDRYGAEPDNIEDVIILTPRDKIEERRSEYPSISVLPIAFNSKELNVQDWMFLLGAIGNDSTYIKQLKAIMKEHRRNITLETLTESIESSDLLSNSQKALARQKLSFAREYIDDSFFIKNTLKPGRLIIVDLRDEFIVKDEALGLFVIMLNIFSGVKNIDGNHFNKFIVFDEAHKYMDNKDLTGNIVTAIREMRHKGVSIMIASQDPPSLPNEIIELSSIVLLHKFNSPQWLKHIQKSITQLTSLTPADMSALSPGEGFLWATRASEKNISIKPIKILTRPRVTKHGGGTIQAIDRKLEL